MDTWRRSSGAEQAAHNRCVGGSSPPAATTREHRSTPARVAPMDPRGSSRSLYATQSPSKRASSSLPFPSPPTALQQTVSQRHRHILLTTIHVGIHRERELSSLEEWWEPPRKGSLAPRVGSPPDREDRTPEAVCRGQAGDLTQGYSAILPTGQSSPARSISSRLSVRNRFISASISAMRNRAISDYRTERQGV